MCAHTNKHTHTRSEEHTSELQSHLNLVCRLLLEKKTHTHQHTYIQITKVEAHCMRHDAHTPPATHAHSMRPPTPSRPPPHTHIHFFFNDTATTEIYTLSLHDALPISHTHLYTHTHSHTLTNSHKLTH